MLRLLSGLFARRTFNSKVTAQVRKLVLKHGRDGAHEKAIRPKGGLRSRYSDGHGGPDHRILDDIVDKHQVRLSANAVPFYQEEVVASVEFDGELVFMKTHGGGVELMVDPTSWYQVIDEMGVVQ